MYYYVYYYNNDGRPTFTHNEPFFNLDAADRYLTSLKRDERMGYSRLNLVISGFGKKLNLTSNEERIYKYY